MLSASTRDEKNSNLWYDIFYASFSFNISHMYAYLFNRLHFRVERQVVVRRDQIRLKMMPQLGQFEVPRCYDSGKPSKNEFLFCSCIYEYKSFILCQ